MIIHQKLPQLPRVTLLSPQLVEKFSFRISSRLRGGMFWLQWEIHFGSEERFAHLAYYVVSFLVIKYYEVEYNGHRFTSQ